MLYFRAALGLAFPAVVDVVVPVGLAGAEAGHMDLGAIRWLGLVPIVAGGALLFDSVFVRFAREGRGTLVPIDPPRFVVRGGAYTVVRNPMYVANIGVIVGLALVLQSWHVLVWAAVTFGVFHAFVVLYEEPSLRRVFGADYEDYCDGVGRWLPRRMRERTI